MRIIGYNLEEKIFSPDIDRKFLSEKLGDKDFLFWVDIFTPTPENMSILKDVFNFHFLAIEDATSKIERPKMDEFENYIFLVMQVPLEISANKKLETGVISIFLGKNYVVTVHEMNFTPIKKIFNDFIKNRNIDCIDSGDLLHTILDTLIDYSFPIAERIHKNIGVIEEKILDSLDKNSISEILILKRNLLLFKNILKPEITLLKKLELTDLKYISEAMEIYFGDIVDHSEKIYDMIETCLELIESLYQSYQALMDIRRNDIMKMLTIISVIFMPLTLISGIYGMNINLPFQNSEHAFIIIMEIMLFIILVMMILFRKKDWL
ncbi:MAG TPA: magnesium/cobalt transporter CorA [bacterium]|nr:magnesium/cobalt transporter CorA [bacterium]HPN30947.1 magnesium/cobalt transporter CorA [bacterium]